MLLSLAPVTAQNPDSTTQPEEDGCARDPIELITGTEAQWVYVNKDDSPQYLVGTAYDAYPTYTDLFTSHDGYDMNIYFLPDPGYEHFLGTANLGVDEEFGSAPPGSMEIEWEQAHFPLFAWPTAGDRVEVMGSWIWDCGHWRTADYTDPTYWLPGAQPTEPVTGERTEIHPPRMVVTHRAGPSTADNRGSVTDVVVSSHGTRARAIQEGATDDCSEPVASDCPRWHPVNDRDYTFEVEAPPRPDNATLIRWQVRDQGSINAPDPIINTTADGIRVTVPFEGWGTDGDEMVFAKTFVVAWDEGLPTRHFQVHLTELEYLTVLDGPQPFTCLPEEVAGPCSGEAQAGRPPDEVNVFVDVAGQWMQLQADGLLSASQGDVFPLDETFELYLAEDRSWRILARGRECDQPLMLECDAEDEFGLNDDAGRGDLSFLGVPPNGTYELEAGSKMCEAATQSLCFVLRFEVTDLGAAGPPPPAPPLDEVGEAPPLNETIEEEPVKKKSPGPGLPVLAAAAGLAAVAVRRRR